MFDPTNPRHVAALRAKQLRKYHRKLVANAQQPAAPEMALPAFCVTTRRAAKSGMKTAQWAREHPKIKSNILPDSAFRAAGLAH